MSPKTKPENDGRGDFMAASVRLDMLDGGTLAVTCAGDWLVQHGMPSVEEVARRMAAPPALNRVTVQAPGLGHWDSSLVAFVAGPPVFDAPGSIWYDFWR